MNSRYFAELVGLAALWGASFLFMRVAVPEFGPVWLIAWRVFLATLVLLPILIHQGLWPELRRHIKTLFIVGAINSALPFLCFAYATQTLSGGVTSILNATVPLFGILLVMLGFNKEKLTGAQIGGFILGFAGVGILLGWHPVTMDKAFWLAVLAGLSGSLLYAISANYIKRKLNNVPALVIAAGSQLSASILFLPLLPFSVPAAMPSLKAILALIALAVFSTALAYLMYFRLIRVLGAARAVTVTYMIPLFAMVWGALLLHEEVTWDMVVGCIVILLGTALANGVFNGFIQKKPTTT
jgi:drug/metabolite transporter (DMT)-like permease